MHYYGKHGPKKKGKFPGQDTLYALTVYMHLLVIECFEHVKTGGKAKFVTTLTEFK